MSRYLAVDLGAESGRVIVGVFDGRRVTLEEVHRFPNLPVRLPDALHWDVLGTYKEILAALQLARERFGPEFAGIGVDSPGADYGLLDAQGRLLGNPVHYRDARTDGLPAEATKYVSAAEQYRRTGIAQLPFNTMYQLMAAVRSEDRCLDVARNLLLVPDLLHYWLGGRPVCERTNASTSGILDVHRRWTLDLLQRLGLPTHMLHETVPPGTVLGRLGAGAQQSSGLGAIPVIAPATHDTACAVVASPVASRPTGHSPAYLSSGTWSLLGVELTQPNASEAARLAGFTNEGGAAGTYCFHTNIMGLWLLQETRRAWSVSASTAAQSYADLMEHAAEVASPGVVINVDDPAFLHPQNMVAAIMDSLAPDDRERLTTPVLLARAILESLALAYRLTLAQVERLIGSTTTVLHIVGGGSRNTLLCQFAADATGREVVAGPSEATALGNVMVQAMATGEIAGLAQARDVAAASAQVRHYEPHESSQWEEREARLLAMRRKAQLARVSDA